MAVKKAKPVKAIKAKPKTKAEADTKARKKAQKEKEKPKAPPSPTRPTILLRSVAETLQQTAFDGEFDLPSMLTKYLEKGHPKYDLGLHREYYVPIGSNVPFYPKDSKRAMMLFQTQAGIILPAIVGEGIKVKVKEFDPPFCKEHR